MSVIFEVIDRLTDQSGMEISSLFDIKGRPQTSTFPEQKRETTYSQVVFSAQPNTVGSLFF